MAGRKIAAIFVGLTAFAAFALVAGELTKALWPDYAMVQPTRSYTLPMLVARIVAGCVATLIAGWLAARVVHQEPQAGVFAGLGLLVLSLVWHVFVWYHYPVWYHLVWLISIMPMAVLGAKLCKRANTASPHSVQ